MNAPATDALTIDHAVTDAISAACDSIAPTWPLDRLIAVNPYWERIGRSFEEAGRDLAEIAGSPVTMPLSYYRDKWRAGEIETRHLARAMGERQAAGCVSQMVAALDADDRPLIPAPLLSDSLDRQRDLLREPAWCDTITHQVAQFCAAHFDEAQADWRPHQAASLYGNWRRSLTRDHSVALLMKAPQISGKAQDLAADPRTQIQQVLEQLDVEPSQWSRYLQAVIMRVGGWASWCAYRRWQARLQGSDDHTVVDLLAIRLSWEFLIDDAERHQGSVWNRWQSAWREHFQEADERGLQCRLVWQRAHEISYQEQLCEKLAGAAAADTAVPPRVQAVFCIDVRSEVLRRHLEAQSPEIQTLGFAGFFGLPISYTPLGTQATRPQLPGLLAPAIDITDSAGDAAEDQHLSRERRSVLRNRLGWRPFGAVPASAFTLVETLGLGFAAKLLQRTVPGTAPARAGDTAGLRPSRVRALRPTLQGEVGALARLAGQALTGMNLTDGLAPLVLLIGHGSQTRNNPQRAGLDCGACCGQTGEVNARALAGLLNDAAVRQRLATDGISIPASTRFVAGLHNTTTDEVQLFDTDELRASHARALAEVQAQLAAAGLAARQERAPALGLADLVDTPEQLTKAVKRRANDWAETRPEWGLANNAAFIVAPRSRTRGIDLAGRSFLHEYDCRKDPDGSLLELIMTAPMIVTHWINMQYHASTVDNRRYGSGNKTLHNVVGGRLGVFEGNGGDLRVGLAWQSVHDGTRWCHEPLRLTVIIDAPEAAIERVITAHDAVRHLVENEWLYLARFADSGIDFYRRGQWQAWKG